MVGSNSKSVGTKVQFDSPITQAVSRAAKSIIGIRVHNNKEPVSPDMTEVIYLNYEMCVFSFWLMLVYSELRRFFIINKET